VWRVAMWHGEVVERLVTLAGAHPLLFQRDMNLEQFWRCGSSLCSSLFKQRRPGLRYCRIGP